jgi:hypothetical protein
MNKLAAVAALAALVVVGSAQAKKPGSPKAPETPKTPKAPKAPATCVPNTVGFRASGVLITASLQAEGNGRYHGLLKVNVAKANHHASTGEETYTLTNARVKFHHGVSATAPPPGSLVKLSGNVTELANKHCSTSGFTPTVTIRKLDIKPAKTK